MPSWNEAEYTKRAGEVATQFVTSKTPINDLAQKVAQENALNPNEIRTLVRLANVAAFQELFKRKDDGDKMIEFETGDPEAVIRRMVEEAGTMPETANINNDKLAGEIPDMMREKRLGRKFDAPAIEKVASEDAVEKPARLDMVVLSLRKTASEFEIEKIAAANRWEEQLTTLSQVFRRAPGYGPTYASFEKDAFASFGEDAMAELTFLREKLRVGGELPSSEKIAYLMDRHVAEDSTELELLKVAMASRAEYSKFVAGLAWISRNMPKLGR